MNDSRHHIISGANVIIIIIILKVFTGQFAFGQTTDRNFCGTPDLDTYLGDISNLRSENVLRRNTVDYYPIQIFSVAKSDGEGRLSELEMQRALCTLNEDYLEYGLQFYMKNPIKEINNDDYYEHNLSDGYKMMRNNNVSDVFNIYVVNDPNSTCGYFSPSNEAIAIGQSCFIGGTHALTHEMGHYLGLPHTFKGWENQSYNKDNVPQYLSVIGRDTLYVETADGSNCAYSGDEFCDTPPDYISDRWNCNADGKSSLEYVDPNGTEFVVDGTNYMSYSEDRCQNMFSPEQEERMHLILETRYSNRRYKFIPPFKVTGTDMELTGPNDEADVEYELVKLTWEPLPDAENYIVQISILPGLLFDKYNKVLQFSTDQTTLTIPSIELKPEQKYYWRVIPQNSFTFCTEPSDQKSFTPQIKSNTHLLPDGNQVKVYPNIIAAGSPYIQVEYKFSTPRDIRLSLFNINGQLISSSSERIIGDIHTSFNTGNLQAGLYVIHIFDGENAVTQKLMVQ